MTIILLIFIGQASAASIVSCSMMPQQMSHADMQMMSGMQQSVDHSSHSMVEMNEINTQSMTMMQDCCSDGSDCSMSGCVLVAVANDISLQSNEFAQQNVISDYAMSPHQSLSSLYRPPIIS